MISFQLLEDLNPFKELLDFLCKNSIVIAVSTYFSGDVILLGPNSEQVGIAIKVPFKYSSGLFCDEDRLIVGFQSGLKEIICNDLGDVSVNNIDLSEDFDIHDVFLSGNKKNYFVNTTYSCISIVEEGAIKNLWKPPFITEFVPEHRCHLNGFTFKDDKPAFATSISTSDEADGWKGRRYDTGALINIDSNQIIVSSLSMPHSPRVHGEDVWIIDTGRAVLKKFTSSGRLMSKIDGLRGFGRGLGLSGGYAFVGLSQARDERGFDGLELKNILGKDSRGITGIQVFDIDTGEENCYSQFPQNYSEVFDVSIVNPNIWKTILSII